MHLDSIKRVSDHTMKWRIFYVDGSTFDHTDGPAHEAPGSGVAAIVQQDSTVGAAVHHQSDFYVFDKQYGGWAGLDYFGLAQYLARPGFKTVKMGEAMTTDGYKVLIQSLRTDPDLPAKSARYPWEPHF